ncbi:MAG: cytochrome c5 family protein [Glaciimonas sp.]|nr:cytochrome c5 family protein [Glaciimonas sp.]
MSDLSNQNEDSNKHNDHQSPIKTPKQLVIAVLAAFIVPIICIVLLVEYVTNDKKMGAGSNGDTPEAVAARIRPVADQGFTLIDVNAPKQLQSGSAVYGAFCIACHGAGVAGSPKFGDTAAWSPRIAQGYDMLVLHAIQGIRGMPAKGGNPALDDLEVARAVVYMANKGGASFKEPVAKAAAPEAAAEAAMPTATPAVAAAPAAPAAAVAAGAAPAKLAADAGKKLYESTCIACHGAGVLGAPKFGDKVAWAPRIKQGPALLYQNAIAGIRMMPPKGGSAASEDEVKAAVDYMTAAAK